LLPGAFQLPVPSVPGVPPTSDGLCHDLPCEFISPRSRFQDSLFKGFPCRTATTPRRRRFASMVVRPTSLPAVARVHRSASRRLQGFTPCGSPLSGPWGLALALPAPFLSFPSSRFRSLSQPHTRACFRSSPYCPSVKSSTQPAYNVFRARSLTGLSQGLPTCSRF